jgi:hypothetical protein
MTNYKPRCPKRRILRDDDAIRVVRARRVRLIDRTVDRLEEAVVRGWSTTRSQLKAEFRAILEDVL